MKSSRNRFSAAPCSATSSRARAPAGSLAHTSWNFARSSASSIDSESTSSVDIGSCSATRPRACSKTACSSSVCRSAIVASVALGEQRAGRRGLTAVHADAAAIGFGIFGDNADRGPRLVLDTRFTFRRATPERPNEPALVLHDVFKWVVILRSVPVLITETPRPFDQSHLHY